MTITHDALDLTVQGHPPSSGHGTSLEMGLHCTSNGHQLRPAITCLLHDPHWYWRLVATEACMVGASGRYTSYRNAFIFILHMLMRDVRPVLV